jgi:hypothetical protein
MTPRQEFVSVSLEVVGFFCVTIDLYGKERFEALTERIMRLVTPIPAVAWCATLMRHGSKMY